MQMLAQLNSLKNANIISYVVFAIIFFSFIKDFGFFAPDPSANVTNFAAQSETLQNLTENCLSFSSSYCIKASLKNQVLTIALLDFKNWIMYERMYTNMDIGAEINRKIDLSNVMTVLQNAKESGELLQVQQGGVINVYVEVWTKNSKQLVKSRLNLIKQRDLRETEIFLVKLEIQKRQFMHLFNNKVSTLEKKNKQLHDRVKFLEETCLQDEPQEQQVQNEDDIDRILYQGLDMFNKYASNDLREPTESRVYVKI